MPTPAGGVNQGAKGTTTDAWYVDLAGSTVPLPTGAATETTLAELDTRTGSVTETAPATDTASSGLNGRLQRIAQRLTTLIADLATAISWLTTIATTQTDGTQTTSIVGTLPVVNDSGTQLTVIGNKADDAVTVTTKLPVLAGRSNASAPTMTEARMQPLSMDLAGNARVKQPFTTRSDTFTTTSSGTTVDLTKCPLSVFTVAVKMTGTVTSWTVLLEGSLDNTNFTTLLTHTNAAPGDGLIQPMTAGQMTPVLYLRTRCSAITLGAGTNVVATLCAVPG